ncbi:HlyD family efflux transporter periplasmic adaptor subunit [Pseudooceanicola sp.]|uniref:HlyD family efflux transporter periplasmic adaptor subunit n=1 Tax=Pseudooceanicola sp. TaxID=1914328 RepID=UPI00260BFCBF|nr:HlyD family efflux transporter periplasmic adaptor subunit [Pseudooceanicola sp.]MDF1855895.1 HlyD family efflux transporter periplasmic adaptor subunit [Pseudooceanicola sp.]
MTRPAETELPLLVDAPSGDVSGRGRRMRKRYLLVLLIPVFMFTGAVIGLYFQPPALQKFYALTGLQPGGGSGTPIALPPDIDLPQDMVETMLPTDVVGLARVMPRGDVALVAAPYGAGDARVAEILVAVGERVARGASLAYLDNRAALESAVFLAQANLAVRRATYLQTRSAVQASRDESQSTLDQARSTYSEAQATLARTEELVARGVSTSVTLDSARTAAQEAALAVTRAEATLARFSSTEIDDQADVVVAARNVEAAEAELARVKLDLARGIIVAPIAGTILDIHATPGQRPPSDGVMEMGDISQMTAEVEVYQDRIATVQPGQPVELVASAIGRTLHGTIESIGLTVGRQGLMSDDVAANTDARVIKVVVALDAESSQIASRFTNLEVIARIDTSLGGRAAQ